MPDEGFDDETLTEDEEFIPPVCAVDEDCEPEDAARNDDPSAGGIGGLPDQDIPPGLFHTFMIVDENGGPVANVEGYLEQNDGETVTAYGLAPSPANVDSMGTSADGRLYFRFNDWLEPVLAKDDEFLLTLRARYDYKNAQQTTITLPGIAPSATFVITWAGAPPPSGYPVQTAGLRIRVVDAAGSPVRGVMLSGSPHTKEAWAAAEASAGGLTEEAILLGPSDEEGDIRWETPGAAGTYELHGYKEGGADTEQYELSYSGEGLEDIILTWKY